MAELNIAPKGGRRKTIPPRIDLTPMVDLGFLLITFFMFTTTLAQEKALEVSMPSNEITHEPTVLPEESTVTLIPLKGHKMIYYKGILKDAGQLKECPVAGATNIIMSLKKDVAALPGTLSKEAHKLHVLIKPLDDCSYDDVVHVLDAMLIVDVPYYAVVYITPEESDMFSSFHGSK